ncbi:hypothetical protein HHK36_030341 [Tetracentron sinense]|uniref:Serine hydroxymethyltransferase-like domain-containing protein n=1 Tax=Tetracentron sinense TaxID=13715 RepID=A0A834YAY4_TETSI|nr:hypothetical protein HHK36_030341 [Tetracentron sinense]
MEIHSAPANLRLKRRRDELQISNGDQSCHQSNAGDEAWWSRWSDRRHDLMRWPLLPERREKIERCWLELQLPPPVMRVWRNLKEMERCRCCWTENRREDDGIVAVHVRSELVVTAWLAGEDNRSPFDYCDIVTSTTHKSLRGPRGGIIFFRKGTKPWKRGMLLSPGDDSDKYDFEERINFAVFPLLQGGPHNNHIAALAIALKQVATAEYKAYMQQVKKNAQSLSSALLRRKCRLVTGGKNYEKVCEMCHITLNKNAIFGDNGAISPGGVRIGTPAMTSRGCLEADFETIADFLLIAAQIASNVQREHGNLQKDFLKGLQNNKDIVELQNRVEAFASQFAMPGFDI